MCGQDSAAACMYALVFLLAFCLSALILCVSCTLNVGAEGQYSPTGETLLRRLLLRARGWRVVSLPVQKWRRFEEEGDVACRMRLMSLFFPWNRNLGEISQD